MLTPDHLVQVFAALPDPTFILSRSGRYIAVYGGSDARYYHDGSHLVGKTVGEVLNPDKAAWFLGIIEGALASRRLEIVEYELSNQDIKGAPETGPQHPIWFEGRVQALDFQLDGEDAVLWVASNITLRHRLEAQLTTFSETDPLTGLGNRRYFDRVASAELARAVRYQTPLSLAIFDIDHFKTINDTCGHKVGDAVLTEVARVLSGCIRESDAAARWGGEEFTLLMPLTTLDAATDAAEKIRRTFEDHAFPLGVHVTISVGVAEWAGGPEAVEGLILRADEALYEAKHGGRNRVEASVPETLDDVVYFRPLPSTLIWRRQYECGEATIDAQHRHLFDTARRLIEDLRTLQERVASDNLWPRLMSEIDQLLHDAAVHFADEEHRLAALGWSGLPEHRKEHQQLLRRAAELRANLLIDRTDAVTSEVISFLTVDVIANHMLRSDRKFRASLAAAA